jgi:hypothetical protein
MKRPSFEKITQLLSEFIPRNLPQKIEKLKKSTQRIQSTNNEMNQNAEQIEGTNNNDIKNTKRKTEGTLNKNNRNRRMENNDNGTASDSELNSNSINLSQNNILKRRSEENELKLKLQQIEYILSPIETGHELWNKQNPNIAIEIESQTKIETKSKTKSKIKTKKEQTKPVRTNKQSETITSTTKTTLPRKKYSENNEKSNSVETFELTHTKGNDNYIEVRKPNNAKNTVESNESNQNNKNEIEEKNSISEEN